MISYQNILYEEYFVIYERGFFFFVITNQTMNKRIRLSN